jgi:outer membrane protein assembly factor BamD
MKQRWLCVCLVLLGVVVFPSRSPAPLIYTPGEGWTYEPVGGEGKWRKTRAKDQLEVAQESFDKKDFDLALKAARRVVQVWPLSDYAPHAEYLAGRSYEGKKMDEKAFKEYQKLIEKYPKAPNYTEVMQRQFEIATRFLHGQRFRLFSYIPTLPSMDKTVAMYEQIVKNGPYTDVAAQAQMNIGAAREKQMRLFSDKQIYELAAKAYESAADRYHDRPKIASDAMYKAGLAYTKQAQSAEYDQSTAVQAANTFSDFSTYYPDDPRVPETQKIIATLKEEQARGNYQVAQFYDHGHKPRAALIYYNEVVSKDPGSPYAATSLKRIAELKKLTEPAPK